MKGQSDVIISLNDYNLDSIPPAIKVLSGAKKLYVSKDTSKGWTLYPPLSALGDATQPRHLPVEIGELSNLQSLTLVNLGLVTLPSELKKLRSLDTLMLFANQLTISNEIDKLKELTNLKYLGLLGNMVTKDDLVRLKASLPNTTVNPGLR